MQTTIIGRLAVAVYPDTSDFHRAAKRQLDEEERRLRVDVPLHADDSKLTRETRQAVREAQAEAGDIEVEVDVDETPFERFRRIVSEGVEANVNLNVDHIKKQILDAADDVELEPDIDTSHIEEQLDKINKNPHIDLEVDGLSEAKDAFEQLDRMSDRLKIDIDRRFSDLADDINEDFGDIHFDMPARGFREAKDRFAQLQDVADDAADGIDRSFDRLGKKLNKKIEDAFDPDKLTRSFREGLQARLEEVEQEFQKADVAPVEPEVVITEPVWKRFKDRVRDIKDKLQDVAKEYKAKIDVDLATPSLLNSRRQLTTLARPRIVQIIPKVNKAALGKAAALLGTLTGLTGIKNATNDLKEFFQELADNAPKVALLTNLFSGLALYLGSAVADMLSFGHSLGRVFGAGFALPGLLGGIVTGLITTVVALSDTNKVIPNVIERFKDLKSTISGKFWAQAEKPFRSLADDLIPALDAGLAKVSDSLGKFFGALAEGVRDSVVPDMPVMFKNLARSIDVATTSTGKMADIIGILGRTGSQYLPDLAQWFVDITTDFDNFLKKADKDGTLKRWINDGISALKELWGIAQGVYGIMGGLGRAAEKAGGSTLESLNKTLDTVSKKVNSPKFQASLTGVFQGLETGMENIRTIVGPALERMFTKLSKTAKTTLPEMGTSFGQMVAGMADAISSPGFQKGLDEFFTGLSRGFSKMRPYWTSIGDGFGAILEFGGKLAETTLPLLGDLFGWVGEQFQKLKGPVGDFVKDAGKKIKEIFDDLKPSMSKLVDKIPGLIDGFKNLLGKLKPLVKPAEHLAKAVLGWAAANLGGVSGDMDDIGDSIETIAKHGGKAADQIAKIFEALTPKESKKGFQWGKFFNVKNLVSEFTGITDLITGFWDDIKVLFGGIAFTIVGSFKGLFTMNWDQFDAGVIGIVTGIVGLFTDALDYLVGDFTDIFHNFKKDHLQPLIEGLLGKDTWKGVADDVKQAGKDVLNGFIDGLASVVQDVKDWLGKFTDAIPFWKGPPAKDKKLLYEAGQDVMQGFLNGLQSIKVLEWLEKFTKSLLAPFKGAGTWLVQKGKELIDGLQDGMHQVAGRVSTEVDNIKKSTRDHLSNAGTWLSQKGRELVDGLQDGMHQIAGRVSTEISNIKSAIRRRLDNSKTLLTQTGRNIADSLQDGIAQIRGRVGDAAGRLKSIIRDRFWNSKTLLTQIGRNIGDSLQDGISAMRGRASGAGSALAGSAKSGARSRRYDMYLAGRYAAMGFVQGVYALTLAAKFAGAALGDAADRGARVKLDVSSPSRVFMEIGRYTGEGFVIGLESTYDQITRSLGGLTDDMQKVLAKNTPEVGVKMPGSTAYAETAPTSGGGPAGGVQINQTIYNPVTENTSEAANDGLATAGLFGFE